MHNLFKNGLIVIIFIFTLIFKGYIYNIVGNLENIFVKDNSYEIENKILIAENKNLKLELNRYQELKLEKYLNYNYKITKLLINNVEDILDKGIILLGEKDNIKENMIVVSNEGLIGIVHKTYKDYSVINFITGKQNISVKINDTLGIIDSYNIKDQTFLINKIDNYANININDNVYTSAYSIYPEDIYLGKVIAIHNDSYNVEKYITIKSDINLYNTFYVGVILGTK